MKHNTHSTKRRNNARVYIDPNTIKGRDPLALALIQGATKSGAFKDRRRESNKRACRGNRRDDE